MATATTAPTGILSNIDLKDFDLNDLVKFLTKVGKRTPVLSNLVTTQMGDATLDNYTPEQIAAMINIPGVKTGDTIDPTEVDRKREERQKALEEAKRNRAAGRYSEEVKKAAERGEYGEISKMIDTPSGKVFAPSQEDIERMRKEMEEYLKGTGTPLPSPEKFTGNVTTIPNIDELTSKPLITPIPENINMDIYTPIPEQKSFDDYIMTMSGPKPKNLTEEADKWLENNPDASAEKAKQVFLNEPDKYLNTGIVNIGNIRDRRKALDIATTEGQNVNRRSIERKEDTFADFKSNLGNIDMNDPQAVLDVFRNSYKKGYAETAAAKQYEETGSLAKSQSANSQINKLIDQFENTEGGFKILKQNEIDKLKPKKKSAADTFAEYYRSEFNPDKSIKDVKTNSEFRFFDNIRRTEPSLEENAEAFFSQYDKESIKPGGDLHEKYLQFEKIDKIRKTNVDELKPILVKILSDLTNKDARADFQIAHKYMTSGIKKGFVSESKKGTGADIAELYIDISDYNSGIQNVLEGTARKIIKQGLEDGKSLEEIKNTKDFKLINLDMENLGVQGEAYGLTIGKAKPIDEKIGDLIIRGLNRGIISDAESVVANQAVDRILDAKKEFEIIFQKPAPLAKGGMVGIATIDDITGPLGKFSSQI